MKKPAEFQKLSAANVSDALDRLSLHGAPHGIGPLWGTPRIVGRAATLKLVPVGESEVSAVTGTLDAIQGAKAGDVLVIDNGGRMDVNSFGGIAGFTANHLGLSGAVIDGVSRDVDEFRELGFPVYGRGVIQQSIRGRAASAGHGIEIQVAGVRVRPGDLVVADSDGVCVVPEESIAEVLRFARLFRKIEDALVEEIRRGADPLEAHERVRYEILTEEGR